MTRENKDKGDETYPDQINNKMEILAIKLLPEKFKS